jgi:hypothetical protein
MATYPKVKRGSKMVSEDIQRSHPQLPTARLLYVASLIAADARQAADLGARRNHL